MKEERSHTPPGAERWNGNRNAASRARVMSGRTGTAQGIPISFAHHNQDVAGPRRHEKDVAAPIYLPVQANAASRARVLNGDKQKATQPPVAGCCTVERQPPKQPQAHFPRTSSTFPARNDAMHMMPTTDTRVCSFRVGSQCGGRATITSFQHRKTVNTHRREG